MRATFAGRSFDIHPDLSLAGWIFIVFAFAWALNLIGLEIPAALLALLAMILIFALVARLLKGAIGFMLSALRRGKG
jgi:hypothetical protein